MNKLRQHIFSGALLLILFVAGQFTQLTHVHQSQPQPLCVHAQGINHLHHAAAEKCLLCEGGLNKAFLAPAFTPLVLMPALQAPAFFYDDQKFYAPIVCASPRGPPMLI